MPRTDITPENRVGIEDKFPKLLMQNDNERMRIWCAEGNPRTGQVSPWSEWVHILKAPVILNGEAVMEERENRDGTKTAGYKLDFIGQPICLGDYSVLADHGLDPSKCPVCESAERGAARPPEIRYAMNVVRYNTKAGSFEVLTPFSAQIFVWAFPASRFSKLVDIQTDSGPLLHYDLLLGPAERPARFQKYEIKASTQGQPAWRLLAANDARVAQDIKTLWTTPGNRATDDQLQASCGRKVVNRQFLLADLRNYEKRWAQADGSSATATTGAEFPATPQPASVAAGLEDLLGSASQLAAAPPATNGAAAAAPVADPFAVPPAAQSAAPAQASAEQIAAIQAAKAQAQADLAAMNDPFGAGDTAPAEGPAPAAETPAPQAEAPPVAETPASTPGPQPDAMTWDNLLGGL